MPRSLGVLLATLLLSSAAAAQEPVSAELAGRLLLADVPLDSGTVVLHRVTPEEAGAIDSVQVGPDGSFRIPLPHLPASGSGEVFFASARYEGILYFGFPVADPAALDEAYEIRVYPTREAPPEGLPFRVSVRNLFVEEGPLGWRVTDLFEIVNDSSTTFVSGGEGQPVWRYPLPPGAGAFRSGDGDISVDQVRFTEGAVEISSAFPPGERFLLVHYELDGLDFTLPLPRRTDTLELLVREPAPALRIAGLSRDQPVELEPGSVYQRWWGRDLNEMAMRVEEGEEETGALLRWLAVGLALFLAVVGIWAALPRRVRSGAEPVEATPRSAREQILVRIAELDEEWDARASGADAHDEVRYGERRAELLAQLRELEGAEPGR